MWLQKNMCRDSRNITFSCVLKLFSAQITLHHMKDSLKETHQIELKCFFQQDNSEIRSVGSFDKMR